MKLILTGSRCAKNRQESVGNPGNPLLPSEIQKRQTACTQLNQAAGTKSVSCAAPQQCRVGWGYGQPMDMTEHTVNRVKPGGQLGLTCPCLKAQAQCIPKSRAFLPHSCGASPFAVTAEHLGQAGYCSSEHVHAFGGHMRKG